VTSQKKIIADHQALKRIVERLRKQGNTIAFTNGCFDILHFGHVSYLEAAKKNGRILIVALNSDASVRNLKGKHRPIVKQGRRARVIAALGCVDYVTIFHDDTPLKIIKLLKPDILIKGADWKGKKVVGEDIVASCGGKVELMKYQKGFSTTQMIHAIASTCEK